MSDGDDYWPPEAVVTPSQAVAKLPALSAEHYQHVGRYAGAVTLAVFEMIGGVQRMASWADQNPTDFYTKMFGKVVQRSTQHDHQHAVTIDDAISNLERQRDQPLLADFSEVTEDAEFYDL